MTGPNNNQKAWDRHCTETPCGDRLRAIIAELRQQNKQLTRKLERRDNRIERLYNHLRQERIRR